MKTCPSLPDTDFARVAPLPADEKRRELSRMKGHFSEWSYGPTRKAIPDLFNAGGALLSSTGDTPWRVVEDEIKRSAKGHEVGEPSNLEVAKLIYDDVRRRSVEATQHSFGPMLIGPGAGLTYWSNLYVIDEGRLLIPLCDFRRDHGFTLMAERFAASVAKFHIFDRYPEFGEAKLQLLRFPPLGRSKRGAPKPARGMSNRLLDFQGLYSPEVLERMIAETRAIWMELHEERVERARRAGGGGIL